MGPLRPRCLRGRDQLDPGDVRIPIGSGRIGDDLSARPRGKAVGAEEDPDVSQFLRHPERHRPALGADGEG